MFDLATDVGQGAEGAETFRCADPDFVVRNVVVSETYFSALKLFGFALPLGFFDFGRLIVFDPFPMGVGGVEGTAERTRKYRRTLV